MEKKRKRKQLVQRAVERKPKPVRGGPTRTGNVKDPFPSHARPTPEECEAVRDTLLALHGIPPELAKYRKLQPLNDAVQPESPEPVLDGLVRTVLSQNTTEANSQKAFVSLKSSFPTWEHVSIKRNRLQSLASVLFFLLGFKRCRFLC